MYIRSWSLIYPINQIMEIIEGLWQHRGSRVIPHLLSKISEIIISKLKAHKSSSATLMLTEESYHRLRGCSVSGMLLRAAPSSMKNAESRRDARKPESHRKWSWSGRKKLRWWGVYYFKSRTAANHYFHSQLICSLFCINVKLVGKKTQKVNFITFINHT